MKRKHIYGILVLIAIVISISLWAVLENRKKTEALSGYLNKLYLEFPRHQYTLLVITETMAGRRFIRDNLWGYRYPSMEPLTFAKRGEFITAYRDTDWIKVSVMVRSYTPKAPESEAERRDGMCFRKPIERNLTPGASLYTKGNDVYILESQLYFGGLKRISAPDKQEYQDRKRFRGPVHIYWDDSSGSACTLISCKKYPLEVEGYNCRHLLVDPESGLEYSMNYDSSLLPHWLDIQNKTVSIFKSFIK